MTKTHRLAQKSVKKKTEFTSAMQTAFFVAIAIFLLLRVAAAFSGGVFRLWGIDYASYGMGRWDVVVALFFPVLAFHKSARIVLARWLSAPVFTNTALRNGSIAFAAALSAYAVYHFQVAYAFLGDGSYYAGEVYRCMTNPELMPAIIKPTSWLTGHVIRSLTLWLQPENVRLPFTILGVAALLVFCISALVSLRRQRKEVAVLLTSLFLFSSGSLMFFGYVELYVMEYSCLLAYFLFIFSGMNERNDKREVFLTQSKRSAWIPGALLFAAILFGASAVIFLPSYLLFLHIRIRGNDGPITIRASFFILNGIALCGGIVLVVLNAMTGSISEVMPVVVRVTVEHGISTGIQRYTLFSAQHLADVINVLVLNAPFGIIAAIVAFVFRSSLRWTSPRMLFAATAAVSAVVFLSIGNTFLGLARDWDLATIPGLALTNFAAMIFLEADEEKKISLSALLPLIFLVTFGGMYAWLRVNFDETASARRLENIVAMDEDLILPINKYTALENLRKFYNVPGGEAQVFHILKKMIATGWHKQDTYNKVMMEVLQKSLNHEFREQGFSWVYDRLLDELQTNEPENSYARLPHDRVHDLMTKALLYGLRARSPELVISTLERYRQSDSTWKGADFVGAFLDTTLTPAVRAQRAKESVSPESRDPVLLVTAARLFEQASDASLAAAYFERALHIEPNLYPGVYLDLAQLALQTLHDKARCIATLRSCLAHSRGTKEAGQAKAFLQELGETP